MLTRLEVDGFISCNFKTKRLDPGQQSGSEKRCGEGYSSSQVLVLEKFLARSSVAISGSRTIRLLQPYIAPSGRPGRSGCEGAQSACSTIRWVKSLVMSWRHYSTQVQEHSPWQVCAQSVTAGPEPDPRQPGVDRVRKHSQPRQHGRQLGNRVDRCHLESGDRLHQGLTRVRPLLCGALCGTLAWHPWPSLWAGL